MKIPIHYPSASIAERISARAAHAKAQKGKCHFCGQPLTGEPSVKVALSSIDESLFPPGFFKWPVHLHHCHHTGMTIGTVHARCNAYLFQYHGE